MFPHSFVERTKNNFNVVELPSFSLVVVYFNLQTIVNRCEEIIVEMGCVKCKGSMTIEHAVQFVHFVHIVKFVQISINYENEGCLEADQRAMGN